MDTYKILIVDDAVEMHRITELILRDFSFEGKKMVFYNAYSGKEAIRFIKEIPDIAVIFLDVVMETTDAGLRVVEYLRKELCNYKTRVILRTGQPGEAPEDLIIRDYDINDYRLKTDMTAKRLSTSLYTALRSYRDIKTIESHQKGLEKIIDSSSALFRHTSLDEFFNSLLSELSQFSKNSDLDSSLVNTSGFIVVQEKTQYVLIAGTGRFKAYVGHPLDASMVHEDIDACIRHLVQSQDLFYIASNGFWFKNQGVNQMDHFAYIEGHVSAFDFHLIQLFLSHYNMAYNNYVLSGLIHSTQKELIITLGEIVEKHFEETSGHVKRISENILRFAKVAGESDAAAEMLSIASTMHDIGKIAIPDAILKKPGRLTPEEFEIIKEHPVIGHKILSKSHLTVLTLAADIAHCHHEKFDGSGYPRGLKGKAIPLSARLLAILDVFDAMTHKRIYKDASSVDDALSYIQSQKGFHFDPELVDLFIQHIESITS